MSGWPSVSVIVPTGGHPADLRRALASVLAQDYAGHLTCVAVFDGVEPFDLSDAEPSRDDRVLVVTRNARTPGRSGSRNTGVSASFDALIAFCGDAEEWLPGKLSAQVEALHAAEDASVVLTGIETWLDGVASPRVPLAIAISNADLLATGSGEVDASSALVDREVFEGVIGPFDEACPDDACADFAWLLRASERAPLIVVRDPLVRVFAADGSDVLARMQHYPSGLRYLLTAHPEIGAERRSLSGMEARAGFACAGTGRGRESRRWALRSIGHRPWDPQAIRALVCSVGLVGHGTRRRWASKAFGGS